MSHRELCRTAVLRAATTVALIALVPATAAGARASRPDPHRFLTWDASRHRAQLTLIAGLTASNNGFNFDGYGRGELLVTIPLGWRVSVSCVNRGATRNSCAVVQGALGQRAAFPGAATADPTVGLAPGSSATFSFVARRVGVFRLACLVPGHAEARQWDVLAIVRGGQPRIVARSGP